MSGWPMVRFGEVADFVSGGTPNRKIKNFYTGEIPWISGADISDSGDIEIRRKITEEAVNKSATNIVPAGTLLLVTRTSVGKVATAPIDLAFSQDITGIFPKKGKIIPEYLEHFIRAIGSLELERKARGVTIKGVSRSDVTTLLIPLPPLEEQKRIAEILQKSAESIKQIVYEIEALEKLSLSVVDHFIRDEVPDKQLLNELVDFHGGSTPSKKNKDFWADNGICWFTSKDLKFDELADSLDHITKKATSETALKPVSEKKSIAISLRGMSLVHRVPMSIIPGDSCVNQDLKALIPKEDMDIYVLFTLLKREEKFLLTKVSSSAHGTRKLDFPYIKTLSVPKLKVDQICRLKQRLQGIQQLKSCLVRKLALLQELQRSLSARAFAGLL